MQKDLSAAIEFCRTDLSKYLDKDITFPTQDKYGKQRLMHVSQVTTLVCFSPNELLKSNNDFSFILSQH